MPDLTSDGVTICPSSLTVEFMRQDGESHNRARVTGLERQDDGSLGPHRWALAADGGNRPEWVAFEVAGCVPDGWET